MTPFAESLFVTSAYDDPLDGIEAHTVKVLPVMLFAATAPATLEFDAKFPNANAL